MAIKGYNVILPETFIADAAVTQYTALVQGTADYHAALPGAANAAKCVGVAMDSASSGDSVPVCMMGTMWVQASGAINAGDLVIIANAQGQVESVGATSSPNIIGQAMSTTAAAGDLCLVKLSIGN